MSGKIIVKNACVREPGFLYYIDGQGNICRTEMARGNKKKKKTEKKTVKPVVKKAEKKTAKKTAKKK